MEDFLQEKFDFLLAFAYSLPYTIISGGSLQSRT